ncbi:hypothetical protein PoB_002787300 [Plakobranchus ocellatus]|uniref:Uncharacterized protein n=1 Tax=Plakobranchus ocellatus TaxID=259542 RepID=A0AAV4A3W6_9GAST|nr:hypothetical protein PoB_002787300 [Plakobranchus ocellatus]
MLFLPLLQKSSNGRRMRLSGRFAPLPRDITPHKVNTLISSPHIWERVSRFATRPCAGCNFISIVIFLSHAFWVSHFVFCVSPHAGPGVLYKPCKTFEPNLSSTLP